MENTVKESIERQRKYFETHKTKDVKFRLYNLKKLKKAIQEYENKITDALFKDLHKSAFESFETEIGYVLDEISLHINKLKKWNKPQKKSTPLALKPAKSYIYNEPYGIVLIISPWNYPFQLLIDPLIGAVSGGNCAILKPAELSSHTSEVIKEMIKKYFDPGFLDVFTGGKETNQALLKEKFDYIFFTGSPGLGKIVMKAAAEHLTPVTLELGGKSPCIVHQDADIKLSAKRIIWGKLLNAGQTCVAPDYLMVHNDIKEDLLSRMKACIKEFYGENPEDNKEYPRIISDGHFDRLVNLMQHGEKICGGNTNRTKRYIEPVILDHINADDPVMQEEIFGPVLPVLTYEKIEEAIQFVNDQPRPLALYFFSKSKKMQKKILTSTSSGGVTINDTIIHVASAKLPFGGVGNSGMGSYHGKYSFLTFTHQKAVMKNPTWIDLPVKYPPYKDKIKWLKLLFK